MKMADILKKTPMPSQDAQVRNKNFDEVALGYTKEMAMDEASRCLNCKNMPCVNGCPVGVPIPQFIGKIKSGEFDAAYDVISTASTLPAICGRVCPQENQCEKHCIRGIKGEPVAIGRLERFAADTHLAKGAAKEEKIEKNGTKVAVVGAGPAGLTCAGALAKKGYDVTVFEAFHKAGGVLVYGIPQFRLPKEIVALEVENLTKLGVSIQTNVIVGRTMTIDELFEDGYKAVFVGTGAGLPSFMGIEGENLNGVYSANEFLTRINLMHAYDSEYDTPTKPCKNVVVVGGGNVAMDAARCALRLGAENVSIVYRRGEAELPARHEEVEHAKEEGVQFSLLCNPTKVLGDENGAVNAVECIRMELGEPDASGRRSPVPLAGSEFVIPCDAVVIAIGQTPNPLIKMSTPDIETNRRGCIVTLDDGVTTSKKGVFAGGDSVTGAATVILAMGAGKTAAEKIDKYCKNL